MDAVQKPSADYPSPRVLIAGAGIGGLTLAQALTRQGFNVLVCEKDSSAGARAQGYRIHINPEGGRALNACLPEALFARFIATAGKPATQGPAFLNDQLEDRSRQISLMPPMAPPSAQQPHPHRAVDRLVLRTLLLEGLEGRVRFGQAVEGCEETAGGRVRVLLTGGKTEVADLVVGADGVGSRTRELLYPESNILDTGWRGRFGKSFVNASNRELFEPFMNRAFTIVNGPNRVSLFLAGFGAPTSSDSYLMWVVVLPPDVPKNSSDPSLLMGWRPTLQSILQQSDPQTISEVAFRETVELGPRTALPRVTLLGDSLHAMLPAGGEGGSNALQDAEALSSLLGRVKDRSMTMHEAITAYEAEAIARGTAAVTRSRKLGQSLFGLVDN